MLKVCIKEKNLPKEFKLIEVDNYLEMYLRADPTFFNSKIVCVCVCVFACVCMCVCVCVCVCL